MEVEAAPAPVANAPCRLLLPDALYPSCDPEALPCDVVGVRRTVSGGERPRRLIGDGSERAVSGTGSCVGALPFESTVLEADGSSTVLLLVLFLGSPSWLPVSDRCLAPGVLSGPRRLGSASYVQGLVWSERRPQLWHVGFAPSQRILRLRLWCQM